MGQSRAIGNIELTGHRTKTNKAQKHNEKMSNMDPAKKSTVNPGTS